MKKILLYIVVLVSLGFTIERKVNDTPSKGDNGIDKAFNAATEIDYGTLKKRGVFGQDKQGLFFSLYEKNPDHPDRTIVKFVRANKNRNNKELLEYFEFDSKYSPEQSQDKGLFYLTSAEIKTRLIHSGATY